MSTRGFEQFVFCCNVTPRAVIGGKLTPTAQMNQKHANRANYCSTSKIMHKTILCHGRSHLAFVLN